MNGNRNIRNALKAARLARRSFKGDNCSKGKGKRIASKTFRRLDKALCREES